MANPKHLAKLKEGVESWNRWRCEDYSVKPDLSAENLAAENLRRGPHRGGPHSADLTGADLTGANLTAAYLINADLAGANLTGANLSGAYLDGAYVRDANLIAANLSEASIGMTVLGNVDLSTVRGLQSVSHDGPSTIGIDTLYRSKGKIPEVFLRGAGVPEQFITYARSLITNPIEFYSCFISYSSKDEEFAARLHADLQAKNLRIWFAPEDLKVGDHFQQRIEESIRLFDKVMIVLSDASVRAAGLNAKSTQDVSGRTERSRTVLFPIRIDEAVMEATTHWAADLRAPAPHRQISRTGRITTPIRKRSLGCCAIYRRKRQRHHHEGSSAALKLPPPYAHAPDQGSFAALGPLRRAATPDLTSAPLRAFLQISR